MHAPHGTLFDVKGDIGLRDDRFQPMGLKLLLAEGAREKAPSVFPALEVDNVGPFQLGLSENHSAFCDQADAWLTHHLCCFQNRGR